MIKIYKKKTLPKGLEVIKINDIYFNKYTAGLLDDKARDIIWQIDQSEMLDKYAVRSRFDGTRLNIDKLSTGCKTALNVLYNPHKVFDVSECGENALETIYSFEEGSIYCEYPMIAFNMQEAAAVNRDGIRIFRDYEELKEWWKDEN